MGAFANSSDTCGMETSFSLLFCADDPETRDVTTPTNKPDAKSQQNGSLELEEEEKDEDAGECGDADKRENVKEQSRLDEDKQRPKKKYTRLCRLRRRRCTRKDVRGEAESDLSEGFESEEEEEDEEEVEGAADSTGSAVTVIPDNPPPVRKEAKKDEASWGSGSEEDEGGTAFDIETDSDMNSQESRSDLEDMEDAEKPESTEGQAPTRRDEEGEELHPKEKGSDANGPLTHGDSSISSNLQAMSSQLFQAKRCFRLAPTFSNMLLRPQASASPPNPNLPEDSAPPSQETPPPQDSPCQVDPSTANGTSEHGNVLLVFLPPPHGGEALTDPGAFPPDLDSDSECSQHSCQSVRSEKTLLEKLEILTNQGLIQVVKIFVDWLRANTDIILMCAQVRGRMLLGGGRFWLNLTASVSPEFPELVESTVCVAQPAPRRQQVTGDRSVIDISPLISLLATKPRTEKVRSL